MRKFLGYISFQRKRDENPYEAIERLDKKLEQVQFNIREWICSPTRFAISQTHKFEENKQFLLKIRELLLLEIDERHEGLVAMADNVIAIK